MVNANRVQRGKTFKVNSDDDDSDVVDEAGEEMMNKLRKANRKSKKTVAIEMLKMIKSNKLEDGEQKKPTGPGEFLHIGGPPIKAASNPADDPNNGFVTQIFVGKIKK